MVYKKAIDSALASKLLMGRITKRDLGGEDIFIQGSIFNSRRIGGDMSAQAFKNQSDLLLQVLPPLAKEYPLVLKGERSLKFLISQTVFSLEFFIHLTHNTGI